MDEQLDPSKDYSQLSPEVVEKVHLPGAKPLEAAGDNTQTGHWSGKPHEGQTPRLPETEPDNMPGDTEVQSKTTWQRY